MSNFVTRFAAVAVIALAAVPVVAVGAANAQTATRISVSDIDFSRADHVAAFNSRVASVQRHFCSNGPKRTVADKTACRQAVREEIVSKLSRQQRVALGAESATRG